MSCVLTGDIESAPLSTSFAAMCGDSLLGLLVRDRSMLSGLVIGPNPSADNMIQVRVTSEEQVQVQLFVVDVTGKKEYSSSLTLRRGVNILTLPATVFRAGAHYVTLLGEQARASGSVMVVR
jgi:hypothetical protein